MQLKKPQKDIDRRQRRRIETREKIFLTALHLFAERGFSATTIDAIAESADIGKGTFFNYFENKESILLQYREMQMARVKEFVAEKMNSAEPLDTLLYQLAVTMSAEKKKNPALFQSLMTGVFLNATNRNRMAEGLARGRELLAELISARQKSGEIRSDLTAKAIALSFQRMAFGTTLLWSFAPHRTLDEHLHDMVNVFIHGIKLDSAPSALPKAASDSAKRT